MAEATKSPNRSPNGQAALRGGPVAARVAKLREQAKTDPTGAREAAWAWIAELGRRAGSDRSAALAELQELFLCGRPAEGVRGQTDGILVTRTMHPLADKVIGTITDAWTPWLGKKFDPDRGTGVNTLTGSARWPAKMLVRVPGRSLFPALYFALKSEL